MIVRATIIQQEEMTKETANRKRRWEQVAHERDGRRERERESQTTGRLRVCNESCGSYEGTCTKEMRAIHAEDGGLFWGFITVVSLLSWMNKKSLFTHFSSTKAVDWPWTIWKFSLFSLHVGLGEVKRGKKTPSRVKQFQINYRV
jgi:hypothetical protein